MNSGFYFFLRRVMGVSVCALACVVLFASAQPAQSEKRVAVPDGAPTLAHETVITEKTLPPSEADEVANAGTRSRSVIQSESRVQGQLASARVNTGTSAGYVIVDPAVGRADRAAGNGRRRVSPSQWELLRF
jgi:hypothetical protein